MFRKDSVVKCIKKATGLTVGNNYVVTREHYGQPDPKNAYDRIEVTNDAGVIRQLYSIDHFEATDEKETPRKKGGTENVHRPNRESERTV